MPILRGRVLFIAFDYHEYSRAIHAEFGELGFDSRFHSIQPGKPYLKIARRLSASLYQSLLDRYHRQLVLSYERGIFDQVVFLQVHQFSHENMAHLKSRQPNARFTLYNWDAVTTHDYRAHLHYFDSVYTFDSADAHALRIGYLPLFCTRRIQRLRRGASAPLSAYFIGNIVNPSRYAAVMAFDAFCHRESIAFRRYLSTTVHGWATMRRAGIRPKGVSLRAISNRDFGAMVESSAAVFDFANHQQTGFTMRTMENLCAGKKIITNNPHVREAEFYCDDRILVFEELDFAAVVEFLKYPLAQPNEDFPVYHIQNFAKRLLGM
jgi:hypothetical protein